MKATQECLVCVLAQALRAARVATEDTGVQRAILDAASERVPTLDLNESPAVISMCAYELAAELSGKADPYGALKFEQNRHAMTLEQELRELVRNGDDPLLSALHLAAAGNIIDLGTMHAQQIDVRQAVEQVMAESFAVEHLAEFRDSLARCRDLLYLLDNAGEIVFDKILVEELAKHTTVTAVVKAGPIINDATMEDAVQVGLPDICEVIDTGGAFIGAPPSLVPESFSKRMHAADMIIGKGQGNYETIDDFPGDVFLILRAKCEIVAAHMGVEFGQVGLISTRARGA